MTGGVGLPGTSGVPEPGAPSIVTVLDPPDFIYHDLVGPLIRS